LQQPGSGRAAALMARALLSVSDKTGLAEFGAGLAALGWERTCALPPAHTSRSPTNIRRAQYRNSRSRPASALRFAV